MTRAGALHVRWKRGRDGPPVLTCLRPDGSATWSRVQEFLPLHDLMHFAVETTLGLRAAFFGLIASGWSLEDFGRPGAAGRLPDEARWAESIVGLLDRERAPGFRWSLEELNTALRMSFDGPAAAAFRDLSGEQLEGIRTRYRELAARWRAVGLGRTSSWCSRSRPSEDWLRGGGRAITDLSEVLSMRIGILGTGAVGQALARGFLAAGHDVMIGTRDPASEKATKLAAELGERARVGAFAEAAAFAEVAVLATLWKGTADALRLATPTNLAGKIVIDATNPLDFDRGVPPTLVVGHTDSGGERVQRWLPGARVVKAFNIVGNAHMVNPQFPGGPPDMFICGGDADAKKTVAGIVAAFGWPAIDLGGIEQARYLEPLAMVWIMYGFRTNSWNHAFRLLRR